MNGIREIKMTTLEAERNLLLYNSPPLDAKIRGGIAIVGALDEDTLEAVNDRLHEAFALMRADESTQHGTCLAYGFEIPELELEALDISLAFTAKKQNHGMLTTMKTGDGDFLWKGEHKKRELLLAKHVGPLLLSDYSAPEGIVYSLSGHRLD